MIYYKKNLLTMISDEQFALLDFKDWILVNDVKDDNLKKWIKYRAGDYPDADEVLKIKDEKGCILTTLGWYESDVKKDKQYVDCIFSMATFFNAFLRLYVTDHEFFCDGTSMYAARLFDYYDELFCDEYKRRFCTKHNVSEDVMKELFAQINIFARNTHTIGNYMPCPCRDNEYNGLKGGARGKYKGYQYFKDRLELLYLELQYPKRREYLSDKRDTWKNWFDNNKKTLLLEDILETRNEELLKFQFNGNKMKEGDIISYKNYLECVNDIIINRGNKLTDKLKLKK